MYGVIYLVVMPNQKGRSGRFNGEMIPPKITVGAQILQVILRTLSFEAGGVLTYSRGWFLLKKVRQLYHLLVQPRFESRANYILPALKVLHSLPRF